MGNRRYGPLLVAWGREPFAPPATFRRTKERVGNPKMESQKAFALK